MIETDTAPTNRFILSVALEIGSEKVSRSRHGRHGDRKKYRRKKMVKHIKTGIQKSRRYKTMNEKKQAHTYSDDVMTIPASPYHYITFRIHII